MRIVSGKYRGKRIDAPRNLPVRPTTDMAKEALFNILNNRYYFEDISVLDLFSGIGSISLEFASRGCTDVVAVDSHRGCVHFLDQLSSSMEAGLQCLKSDCFTYLENTGKSFDIIFADPPYDLEKEDYLRIAGLVFDRGLLEPDGSLILEHQSKMSFEEHPNFAESRKYGNSSFSFFVNSASS